MIDLALDKTTHDLTITGNNLVIISGAERIAQAVKVRLLTIVAEWFLDSTIGVLDFKSGRMFGKGASLSDIRKKLLAEILATPGIASASILSLGFAGLRQLKVTWTAKTVTGVTLTRDVVTP